MIVDLLHNKIVKETMSEAFERSVNENLIPKLSTLYGTSLQGIQMYEDYLNDDFSKDGYWYYPLTVLIADINAVIWIKWDVSDTSKFDGKNPYAYLGEGIDFVIADDVPMAFKSALDGRDSYFGSGFVKTNVVTDGHSASILVGKYSQTFIDEMTRQISAVIEKSCGVSGIANSSIEIDVVFAHNTYMEHTSENVTYRRLLISAKGCAPRDFWIKWTRQNSSVAYSVNDNVNKDDIIFELGEDVPHKTREKEYRFLVYGNSEKYRVAMGRKNITEWRELIKRAVKRGELEKTTTELERDAHVSEVSDKLSEILEKYGMTIPTSSEPEVKVNADVANEALRHAVLGDAPETELEASSYDVSSEAVAELEIDENTEVAEDSFATAEDNVFTFAGLEITDEAAVVEDDFDFDKEHEQFEIIIPEGSDPSLDRILSDFVPGTNEADDDFDAAEREDMSVAMDETFTLVNDSDGEQLAEAEREFYELESVKNAPADICNEEKIREKLEAEYLENVATLNSELEIARAEIISLRRDLESARMAKEDADGALNSERTISAGLRTEIEKQKFAIEQVRVLVDDASNSRLLAEAEAERLRGEYEALKRENESLVEAARVAKEACSEAEAKSRIYEAKLEEQIELFEKEKIRQKNLFAEAARQAKEECDKTDAELAEDALRRIEEARLADMRAESNSGEQNVSDVTFAAEEAERRKKSIEERAREARLRMEERARAAAEARMAASDDCAKAASLPIAEEVEEKIEEKASVCEEEENKSYAPEATAVAKMPVSEHAPKPVVNYTYSSRVVRLLFKRSMDPNVTARIHELINEALTKFEKSDVYMKVKAGIADNSTVILNFVEFPNEEFSLLVDIIKHIGNSDIGVYKIILD